jgi:signal transduction histidine kinase
MIEAASTVARRVSGIRSREVQMRLYEVAVSLPTVGLLVSFLAGGGYRYFQNFRLVLGALFWIGLIWVVELLPVPAWKSLRVSMAFPLYTAVGFFYPPAVAGAIAFLGSSDPREFRREVTLSRALFNRSQVALAVFAASSVFHALQEGFESWTRVLLAAAPAVLVFHLVNSTLVSFAARLVYDIPIREAFRRLRIGNTAEFLTSYLALGFLGLLLARLYTVPGWWAVAAFAMPLLLARQMFFRTRALEEATKELRDREALLRALSNRMAEERHDERMQIAGYLHDDLAQVLFRMSLHIDIGQKHLDKGNVEDLQKELESIRSSRDRTMELVRSLIKDLRQSPLGRAGLAEAIASFCADAERTAGARFVTRLQEVGMPPPVQLLCYQVAREAVMNAVKHSNATEIRVALERTMDGARVTVEDDGAGFDVERGSPEGHFGLTMMRERAQVAGGTFRLESEPGEGTKIIAEFPTSWLSQTEDGQATAPDAQQAQA